MAEFKVPPGAGNRPEGSAVLDRAPARLTSMKDVSEEEKQQLLEEETPEAAARTFGSEDPEAPKPCPMCGWNTRNQDIVDVTEKDKMSFISAVLGGKRFRKTYERMGGRVKITMRSRTVPETDEVMRQLERDRKNENLESMTEIMVRTWHYQMVIGLEKVEMADQAPIEFPELDLNSKPGDSSDEYLLQEAGRRVTQGWHEHLYSMIQNASRHFDQVVQALTLRAHDADFWNAADTDA